MREKLWMRDGKRFVWVAVSKKVMPGQIRVAQSVNKLSQFDRRFLLVIGDTREPGRGYDASKPHEQGWADTFMKWLVLRSDGSLGTEYQSTLEGMYLVTCEDPKAPHGELGA